MKYWREPSFQFYVPLNPADKIMLESYRNANDCALMIPSLGEKLSAQNQDFLSKYELPCKNKYLPVSKGELSPAQKLLIFHNSMTSS